MTLDAEVAVVPPRRRQIATRVFCLALVALFLASRSGWHEIGGPIAHSLTPLGILFAAFGALGRLWCSSYIGGNKNSRLVTAGPYSLTRNPLYVFSLLGGVGIAITTETLTIPLLFVAWFLLYHQRVVLDEEAYLRIAYGAQFEAYRARIPRFWPRLSGWVEPLRWELSPIAFRRSLTEVVWFVVAAIALHTLHDLRAAASVPSLFALY